VPTPATTSEDPEAAMQVAVNGSILVKADPEVGVEKSTWKTAPDPRSQGVSPPAMEAKTPEVVTPDTSAFPEV